MKPLNKVEYKKVVKKYKIKKDLLGKYKNFPRKIKKQLKIKYLEYLLGIFDVEFISSNKSHFYSDYYNHCDEWYFKIRKWRE